jgi:hypothetical protein
MRPFLFHQKPIVGQKIVHERKTFVKRQSEKHKKVFQDSAVLSHVKVLYLGRRPRERIE